MTAYVDRGEHLKLCMNLLKDDRKMVQYEGFHVFKVNRRPKVLQPSLANSSIEGFRCQPPQICSRTTDPRQQPGETPELSAQIPRGSNRRWPVHGWKELPYSADWDHDFTPCLRRIIHYRQLSRIFFTMSLFAQGGRGASHTGAFGLGRTLRWSEGMISDGLIFAFARDGWIEPGGRKTVASCM